MLPSSADLSYFVTIADSGSFSAAAQRLGIAQPSLTLAVQRLESNFGTSLLIRSRQGVKPTKAGEKLLGDARDLLQRWENLRAQALSLINEVRGTFKLGVHPSVAIYSLPLFLPKLLAQHPHLEVRLIHDLSRNITQKLISSEVDLGIIVNASPHPDLVLRTLGKDEVTVFASNQTYNADILICEPSLVQTQEILRKLRRHNIRFRRIIECGNLEVIHSLALAGAGAAILPSRVAKGLTAVTGAPKYVDEIFLAYRAEQRGVAALQKLSAAIQLGFQK